MMGLEARRQGGRASLLRLAVASAVVAAVAAGAFRSLAPLKESVPVN